MKNPSYVHRWPAGKVPGAENRPRPKKGRPVLSEEQKDAIQAAYLRRKGANGGRIK
jgi:hypothetical protein